MIKRSLLFATLLAVPSTLVAAPNFPVDLVGEFCWDQSGICGLATWTIRADGTFVDDYGGGGSWTWDGQTQTFEMTYGIDWDFDGVVDDALTVYQGSPVPGACVEGTSADVSGLNPGWPTGTWWACL